MRRVAVTGMAGISSLGDEWDVIRDRMKAGETGTRGMPQWDYLQDLDTRIAAPAPHFVHEKAYPRKKIRSMGRVATLAVSAAERASDMPHRPVYISGVGAGHPDSPASITQRPDISALGLGKAAPRALEVAGVPHEAIAAAEVNDCFSDAVISK